MRKFIGCLVLLAAMATPAMAASANFQGNCTLEFPNDCVFDPQRAPSSGTPTACPGSSVKRYFWDFGDGTSFFVTPPPHQTSHTYTSYVTTNICLTVFCNDNTSSPPKCYSFSNVIGIGGVIPGTGWSPY